MDSSVRFRVGFGIVLVGYLAFYTLFVTIFPKYPLEHDLPNYMTTALQAEQPQLYHRDPVFGDGSFTKTVWSSSYLYLSLLQTVRHLTNSNISAVMAVMQLIPAFISVITFYWFLRSFRQDRWLTLIFSIGLSVWLLIRHSEGVATLYYFALIPLFSGLLWRRLLEPSLNKCHVVTWQVVAVGFVIGISPLLINSVNGLGFSVIVLGLATVQWLAGRMRFSAYLAFCVPIVLLVALLAKGGTGGSNMSMSEATAQYTMDRAYLYSLMYSFTISFPIHAGGELFTPATAWMFYVPLALLVTGFSIRLRWVPRSSPLIKILYLTLCWLFWSWVLGNVSLILYMYFLYRFARQEDTELDHILIAALNVGIFASPILMLVMVTAWQLTHWTALVSILLQSFRFQYLVFFIVSVPLLLMFAELTKKVQDLSVKRLIWCILTFALVLQPQGGGINLNSDFYFLGLMVLLLLILSSSRRYYFTKPLVSAKSLRISRRKGVAIAAFVLIGLFGLKSALDWLAAENVFGDLTLEIAIQRINHADQHTFQADYVEMTEWLRLNTPVDSLIHFDEGAVDQYGFFRYLTQRALLFTWLDEQLPQFRPDMSDQNMQIVADVQNTPELLAMSLARRYDVNYIAIPNNVVTPLPVWGNGVWYTPQVVHENPHYRVYEVAHLTTQEFKTWLAQSLFPGWAEESSAAS